jgi:hypothetical protein
MTVFRTVELNGKMVAYTDDTEFLVQVGYKKGSYKTHYTFKGNIHQAVMYYRCINVGRGYKKRLLAPSFNKPLLARAFS